MKSVGVVVRRYALSATVVLVAAAVALCVYTVIHQANDRAATILAACRDQNARHAATIDELNTLYARFERGASKTRLVQLRTSKGFTLLLVDRLAPQQDCQAVVSRATR